MKKLLMIAVLAGLSFAAIGCGGAPTTKPTTGSTEVKQSTEKK